MGVQVEKESRERVGMIPLGTGLLYQIWVKLMLDMESWSVYVLEGLYRIRVLFGRDFVEFVQVWSLFVLNLELGVELG